MLENRHSLVAVLLAALLVGVLIIALPPAAPPPPPPAACQGDDDATQLPICKRSDLEGLLPNTSVSWRYTGTVQANAAGQFVRLPPVAQLEMRTCQLRRFTPQQARACLANKPLVRRMGWVRCGGSHEVSITLEAWHGCMDAGARLQQLAMRCPSRNSYPHPAMMAHIRVPPPPPTHSIPAADHDWRLDDALPVPIPRALAGVWRVAAAPPGRQRPPEPADRARVGRVAHLLSGHDEHVSGEAEVPLLSGWLVSGTRKPVSHRSLPGLPAQPAFTQGCCPPCSDSPPPSPPHPGMCVVPGISAKTVSTRRATSRRTM